MSFLYSIAIRAYGLAIRIASVKSEKARKWITGRKEQDFKSVPVDKKLVWFHCASLGEFDQGIPLMFEWKKQNPNDYILVTFFSPSGKEHCHKRNHPADEVVYLPIDTKANSKQFIHHYKPHSAIFVKYEFWHNVIREAKNADCKLYSLSTILRPHQIYFKWYGSYFRNTLKLFDYFFVQNTTTLDLLHSIGIQQCVVSGDARYDKVIDNLKGLSPDEKIERFKGEYDLLIAGSTWPVDETLLAPVINQIETKVLIAPHQIDDKHIVEIENKLTKKSIRYSTIKDEDLSQFDILILDTIGQLSNAYQYGDIAYVGGGFTGKLHNILEPAVFGQAILIGPKHTRFPEALQLIDAGVVFEVSSSDSCKIALNEGLQNRSMIREKASAFIAANSGVSSRVMNHINSIEAGETTHDLQFE